MLAFCHPSAHPVHWPAVGPVFFHEPTLDLKNKNTPLRVMRYRENHVVLCKGPLSMTARERIEVRILCTMLQRGCYSNEYALCTGVQ